MASGAETPMTPMTPMTPGSQDGGEKGGKQTNLDKLVTLIQREPDCRMDFECNEVTHFLKKYIEWFNGIKNEHVKEIIKHCQFLRCEPETVIIKQGDVGDSMFAILRGDVSVHVIFDVENEKECRNKVELAMAKKKFNKNDFGVEVAHKGSGTCIGEVALIQENCMRTASCITSTECEIIVIERALYNVSVKEFIEKEFQDKTDFVEKNPLFSSWPYRQRNQLVIGLKKVTVTFGDKLVKQGQDLDGVYFIIRGDMEIYIDSRQYKRQFPRLYEEMQALLPDLVHEHKPAREAPHVLRKERMSGPKKQQICILGVNESIGSLETILGLDSYIETAAGPGECELVMIKRSQFERIFKRKNKYATVTLEMLREALAQKLCLYIHQAGVQNTAFHKFLNMKLMDATVLKAVKRNKYGRGKNTDIGQGRESRAVEEQVLTVLKRLHMNSDSAAQLPPEDMSVVAISKMDTRLRLWSEKTNMTSDHLAV